ncbi:transcription termination factor NusG [Salmonella enterica]|uniref:Transcription termination factor NusG n=1 Tax=Salmonella enterica subsp. enterica serovar Java TaxID=224729 RepID=A0A3Y9C7E1_SALEB|nr:transcription termination factor NusG [Salmonella enterica subsp. enterica serovar Java]EAP0946482.1 transcription termination factor NusG [Salmonella enterica]EBG5027171.1 transcription termination factor NusG [Salmonella enterica subsp. enterica serovar Oranienburg]ECG6808278.1 transcription termination factor NusG [Salmonella enterica subsp. enterica serovar Muenchen]EGJ3414565.1 transcription termination factor NusG [Salmonella enterica subsp. houtenae]
MKIDNITGRRWYLARHLTSGKNREMLFHWLSEMQVTPWTPLIIRQVRRTDAVYSFRRKISAVFPGYFFLRTDLSTRPAADIRRHSAFIDFVQYGSTITPVCDRIVDGLMKVYPEPALNPGAREALDAASRVWLTQVQYQHLLRLENNPVPASRISMLLELVFNAGNHGFME